MNIIKIEQTLIQMPEHIRKQAIAVMDTATEVEKLRVKIAERKLVAQVVVAYNPEYTNDKARTAAQAELLASDNEHRDLVKGLEEKETKQKHEQIELDCLNNTFRAYLAIAGMMGAR